MNPQAFAYIAAGLGAGLTIIGGAAGIGRLAAAAMEGIARQPNAAAATICRACFAVWEGCVSPRMI